MLCFSPLSVCQSHISAPDALLILDSAVHPVNTQQMNCTTLESDHEVKAAVCTKHQAADSCVSQLVWKCLRGNADAEGLKALGHQKSSAEVLNMLHSEQNNTQL